MISTKNLVLKPYSDEDQEDMILLLMNEKIKLTYMIPDFKNKDEALSMFNKLKERSKSNDNFEYGIYKDNKLIGWINEVYKDTDKIEVGYVIDPNYHNKGYATEVLQAIIDIIFSNETINEVVAGAFENNIPSIRVMEKCGMKRIDKEEDIIYQNKSQHCIYYSIKRENRNI